MNHNRFSQATSAQKKLQKVGDTTMEQTVPENLDRFPLDAFPPALRISIEKVHAKTHAPIPMIVASALGALSLAQQGRINVKSPAGHLTPTSLYLVTLTDSTPIEKTNCNRYFMQGIHDVHHRLQAEDQLIYDEYVKAQTAWKKSRRNARSQPPNPLAHDPCKPDLAVQKPVRPPKIKMISSDFNPASIRKNLQEQCPFGSLISSQADMLLNSKSTTGFTLFNTLWNGISAEDTKKSSKTIKVNNNRFTLSLTIQPDTLVGFLKARQGKAESNEFLTRSLVCWPHPLPGVPASTADIHTDPVIQCMQGQLAAWIEESWQRFHKNRSLDTVTCIGLAADDWHDFIHATEHLHAPGPALHDIAAVKAGDNALRIAALFSQYQEDSSTIEARTMQQAIRVMKWYIGEHERLFGQKTVLTEMGLDMQRMREHLRQKCLFHGTFILRKTSAKYIPSTTRLRANPETVLSWLQASGEIVEGVYGDKHERYIACDFVDPQASINLTGTHIGTSGSSVGKIELD